MASKHAAWRSLSLYTSTRPSPISSPLIRHISSIRPSTRPPIHGHTTTASSPQWPSQPPTKPHQTRFSSTTTTSTPSTQYSYTDIQKLTTSPSPSRILIDVREPSELAPPTPSDDPTTAGGTIPTSINIPLKSSPDALFLPAEEFADRFGFEKPRAEQEVVFFCRSGVRSKAAAEIAKQAGYQRVGEYQGSWLDWVERKGVVQKVRKG